jgi:ubiquitin-protein ligase
MANDELMMDFQNLKENIHTFTYGEARIIDFDTKEPSIKVELYFKTGFHKDRAFVFQFFPSTSYPIGDQKVVFLMPILHPAVDRGNIIEVQGNGIFSSILNSVNFYSS